MDRACSRRHADEIGTRADPGGMSPYGHHWRTVIRPRILDRDGRKCCMCDVPNRVLAVHATGRSWWLKAGCQWFSEDGSQPWLWPKAECRQVRIRLEVCHLDRDLRNDDDGNLGTLCQYCHRNYDRPVSVAKARYTRAGLKDKRRPLLAAAQQSLPASAQESFPQSEAL